MIHYYFVPSKQYTIKMQSKMFLPYLVVLVGVVSLSHAKWNSPRSKDWQSFKNFHAKRYRSQKHEDHQRAHFESNKQRIEAHNAAFQMGRVKYTLELNEYADHDPLVFRLTHNGLRIKPRQRVSPRADIRGKRAPWNGNYMPPQQNYFPTSANRGPVAPPSSRSPFPTNFDWRSQLKVSAVKNQGQCGSCWSFTAMGALESQMLIRGVPLKYLSEQQLVDCDTNDHGCSGGDPEDAWRYLQSNGGAMTDADYPYISATSGYPNAQCKFNQAKVYLQVKGFQDLPTDENSLKTNLMTFGPLAIGLDGTNWQLYNDGIMECFNPQPDHAVLLIGWGVDSSGNPFWWVKNSWGTGWGNDGFAKVSRVPGQDCGITQAFAGYPII